MTPGRETAAGFFVGAVRGPDAPEKWQPRRTRSAPTAVFCCFSLLFSTGVCARRSKPIARAHVLRLQQRSKRAVGTQEIDGTAARPALPDKGDPKLRIGGLIVLGLLFTMTTAADRRLRHRLGLRGGASWQIDPIARLRIPCRRPQPQSAGDPRA